MFFFLFFLGGFIWVGFLLPTLHGGLPQHVVRPHQREEAGAGSRASSLSHQGLCTRIVCNVFYGIIQYLVAGGKTADIVAVQFLPVLWIRSN